MKKFLSSLLLIFATMLALPARATLPAGYTELEYVVFNGASYIDTGIVIKDPRNIEQTFWVQFDDGTTSDFQSLFGFMKAGAYPRYAVSIYSGVWMLGVNTTDYGILPQTHPYQLKFVTTENNQTLYDTSNNAVLISTSMTDYGGFADNTLTSFFGARNYPGGDQNYVSGKMGASYMKQNGVLVYNYIPAQYNNTVGFYDTVSNTFKTATVGTFVAGPVANGIKIATTAYNDAQFAPVEAALETAVTTIKDVVANTIVQADAIQNLQDTKQTMPDASGTNGTCPRFRQCLLIETDDGTPEWYPIIDPFKDFVTPILANNDHITPVDSQRRYYGDQQLCTMLADTEFSKCDNNITAKYKINVSYNSVHGALNENEWGYEFKAADIGATPATDNPNNDEGIVYGISKCVSTDVPVGTFAQPATSTQLNNALWNARPTTAAEADKYRRCWCKTTGIAYGGQYYETSAAPWVFYSAHGSAAGCASGCAGSCAYYVRGDADFRSAVLGWAIQ